MNETESGTAPARGVARKSATGGGGNLLQQVQDQTQKKKKLGAYTADDQQLQQCEQRADPPPQPDGLVDPQTGEQGLQARGDQQERHPGDQDIGEDVPGPDGSRDEDEEPGDHEGHVDHKSDVRDPGPDCEHEGPRAPMVDVGFAVPPRPRFRHA